MPSLRESGVGGPRVSPESPSELDEDGMGKRGEAGNARGGGAGRKGAGPGRFLQAAFND